MQTGRLRGSGAVFVLRDRPALLIPQRWERNLKKEPKRWSYRNRPENLNGLHVIDASLHPAVIAHGHGPERLGFRGFGWKQRRRSMCSFQTGNRVPCAT